MLKVVAATLTKMTITCDQNYVFTKLNTHKLGLILWSHEKACGDWPPGGTIIWKKT